MIPQNTESGLVEKQNKTNKQTNKNNKRTEEEEEKPGSNTGKVLSGNTSHWGCSGSS